jgi:hypothetical protein
VASPSPVPFPTPFFVKNGSKRRAFVAASMPRPVSRIVSVTNDPGWASLPQRDASSGERIAFAVSIDSVPPPGHLVARIDDEVDDHLLQLPRVGLNAREARAVDGDDFDVLADQAAQHRVHVADDVVDVQNLRLQELLAAEGE